MNTYQRHYQEIKDAIDGALYMAEIVTEIYKHVLDDYGLAYTVDGILSGLEAARASLKILPNQGPLNANAYVAVELGPDRQELTMHLDCIYNMQHYGEETEEAIGLLEKGTRVILPNRKIVLPRSHEGYKPTQACALCGNNLHEYPPIL